MLQGRKFTNPWHHTDPHRGVTEKWSQKEGRRGWCRWITRQQAGELLVLLVLHPVTGRQMGMMKLMMRVRGSGTAAEDVLDQKRGPVRRSAILTWLGLLLLASRLHFPRTVFLTLHFRNFKPVTFSKF